MTKAANANTSQHIDEAWLASRKIWPTKLLCTTTHSSVSVYLQLYKNLSFKYI